jgi:hypothetical protein
MPYPAAIESTPGNIASGGIPRGSLLARVVTPVTAHVRELQQSGRVGEEATAPSGAAAVPGRPIPPDPPG